MAERFERQHTLRQRAIAGVAHEPRIPLRVLQIDPKSTQDDLRVSASEIVAGLQEEIVLSNRLIDDLQILYLAAAGELYLAFQPLDLRKSADFITDPVRGAAWEKGVTVYSGASSAIQCKDNIGWLARFCLAHE